jgi:hypothetical protein
MQSFRRRDRMRATLREIKEELRLRMHQPIPEQGAWIRQVVTGFFAYHVTDGDRGDCQAQVMALK